MTRGRSLAGRRGALALAAAVALGLAALVQVTGVLRGPERQTVAARFALRHVAPPRDVVIVGVDDSTFDDLNRQWPFPRSMHARVVDRLHAAGAREIVYDVQFTEPTKPAEDYALYRAIARAGGAVLATSESDEQGHTNVLGGDDNLATAHSRAAAANLANTAGGAVTHFPYAVSNLKSIAITAAERAGVHVSPAAFRGHGALIDYRGGPGSFRTVSFTDVLRGRVPASVFRGKIVVVGAVAPTLQDMHATPLAGNDLMSGPEVQANAIWTALHGIPLRDAPGWAALVALMFGALAAPLLALRLGLAKAALGATLLAVAYLMAAQLTFDTGVVLDVAPPLAACALGTVAMLAAGYFTASADGRLLAWVARRRTEQLAAAQLEIVERLAQAAESRDEDTGEHIKRIGNLCAQLALKIGLGAGTASMLRYASAMHDVGKIAIPDRVLLKPGRLDPEEWELMKTHTTKGAELLAGSSSPLIQMAEEIALTHHERWDGSGYPAGLRGDEIPLFGRICAVCDVFDALVSKRPYKEAWPPESALRELARGRGSHFDPALVDAFLDIVTEAEETGDPDRPIALGIESLPPLVDPQRAAPRA